MYVVGQRNILTWLFPLEFIKMSQFSKYSIVDYVYSLYLISRYGKLGRYRLAQYLGFSKDQTRTIIQHLVDLGLLEMVSPRQGHQLSAVGLQFVTECKKYLHIPMVRVYFGRDFTLGTKDAVVCLEGSGIDQLNTVVLRDEALIAGSMGCTVFFQASLGEFYLLNVIYPPLPSSPIKIRKIRSRIEKVTQGLAWEKILIIVGTADSVILAQKGALAAGLLLVPNELLKQFFRKLGMKTR